ncbi:N-acetylmuramoyl-L-alanine amidase [Fluviicola taffensis]|uniref:N-acetylmuramoyl-L-alanine amidase n=1 Tax=Fluviicola taffensis (strain DSM 16823 / NCIMB 13979 / RW262) TaxID=755732 RepID=F2ICX1_FLUTR|nr:N-acetylmuramoyl-L-alanine amidase [Fluviicola taffensis]AEA43345.1 cell wall hydrolase/autolysin [Fluviicola taffensis DSM 16823]
MRLVFTCLVFICLSIISFGQGITILIDPGHGGSDPGHEAVDKNLLPEKDLTLKISLKFGAYLTERLSNVTVLYTRTDDRYPTLDERVNMANSKNVDYFISVHVNGSPNTNIKGTESHVHSMNSKPSVKLARAFEEEFKGKAGRKSRGVKDSDDREHSLQVLKFTQMTSVLVECGFMTNVSEANYLNTTDGQDIIASALFRGMRTYLQENHPTISFTKKSGSDSKNTQTTNSAEKSYSVQIMSSKEWLDTEKGGFKNLKHTVSRTQISQTGYRYKYFSGSFNSKSEAEAYCAEVKKKGFPDSIVVERKN